jgi:N-acetylglucosaminyldiphosphoundecaprenol N-acetyl-beta-D-mannosaminyltransferase
VPEVPAPEPPAMHDARTAAECESPAEAPVKMPVLRPVGRIDVTNAQRLLQDGQAAIERDPHVILSLADVTFLDSTALGALVALANQARGAGGTLYLVEVSKPISDLLTLVRLERFFEMLPDAASVERQRARPAVSPDPQPAGSGWAVVKSPRMFDAGTAPTLIERCEVRLGELPRLVVDLSETVFLASAGMAALMRLDRAARESGGELRVAGCSPEVMRTLRLVKLDTILKIFPTVKEAIADQANDGSSQASGVVIQA